jgi:class 3 adenylate cyclase
VQRPEIAYARSEGAAIAYQMIGDGPLDLVFVQGFVSNLELNWELPGFARFLDRLASFSRLIIVDRRGAGLSDPLSPSDLPSHEKMIDDLRAVMDAAESDRAALMGIHEGGVLCTVFAAAEPARTTALMLFGTAAAGRSSEDYPWQWTEAEWAPFLDELSRLWGTRDYSDKMLEWLAPSLNQDRSVREWWARYCRMGASPSTISTLERIYSHTDIRAVLHSIHVPTLVLHSALETHEPVEGARYIASHIDGARLVELPGRDAYPWGEDADAIVDEIQEFLTGVRPSPILDRILSTVMFTDIVGSTSRQAELGDHGWKELVLRHHGIVRDALRRWRGVENDTAGDGFYATFDGPARAVRCAIEVTDRIRDIGVEVRAGVHTGECELIEGKCGGLTVSIGARVAARAAPSEVLVSRTVKDLVAGSGLIFEDAGEHELKGVPDHWRLYRVIE